MLSPMRLERLFTHRLIQVLRVVLPVVVTVLIAIPAWNYFRLKETIKAPRKTPTLPKDLSIKTDNINFSKTEGGRTLFTIHAKAHPRFVDYEKMLHAVVNIIF